MGELITVGLDLSLTGTGVCVRSGEQRALKTISTGPRDFKTIYDRIDHIADQCLFMIPETVRAICIESPFVRICGNTIDTSSKNLISLAHMVRRAIAAKGFRVYEVSASQLKKFILGKGQGEKALILKEVYKVYQVDTNDNNQADALVLSEIARAIAMDGEWAGLSKANCEVVKKILQGV